MSGDVLRQRTAERCGGGRGRRVGDSYPKPGKVRGAEVGVSATRTDSQEETGRAKIAAERSRTSFPPLPSPEALHPREAVGSPGRPGSREGKLPPDHTEEPQDARRLSSRAPSSGRTLLTARIRRIHDATKRREKGCLSIPKGCWKLNFFAIQ